MKRYHNRVLIQEDTVGCHSNRVAWFCMMLIGNRLCTTDLLMAAVTHDIPEAVTGDIPSPVKKYSGDSGKGLEKHVYEVFGIVNYEARLSKEERVVLKLADALDGFLFTSHEYKGLGNKRIIGAYQKYDEYVLERIAELPEYPIKKMAKALYAAIIDYFDQSMDEETRCGL